MRISGSFRRETPDEGIGCVEAPRGTLTHHYQTDERGILTHVNLIVGTTNNNAPINMSIKRAAEALIQKGTVVSEGLLNKIEMAFRAYDPCLGCATHSLPGQMPLEVTIRGPEGEVIDQPDPVHFERLMRSIEPGWFARNLPDRGVDR